MDRRKKLYLGEIEARKETISWNENRMGIARNYIHRGNKKCLCGVKDEYDCVYKDFRTHNIETIKSAKRDNERLRKEIEGYKDSINNLKEGEVFNIDALKRICNLMVVEKTE